MGKVRGSNFERETELENQLENEGRIDGRELGESNSLPSVGLRRPWRSSLMGAAAFNKSKRPATDPPFLVCDSKALNGVAC